jgi:hypothetical protein
MTGRLPEDAANGNGDKSLQDVCNRRIDESILGSTSSIGAPVNRELVCIWLFLGQIGPPEKAKSTAAQHVSVIETR